MKAVQKTILVGLLTGSLAGCAGTVPIPIPNPVDDLTACGQALLAAGTSNPGVLLAVAVATPACQRLAQDALQALIASVGAHQAKRGLR